MKRIFLFAFGLSLIDVSTAGAQVANNDISNRSELILDSGWLHSNTSNSSVEWECVNKTLTNKCLVYHNDQWFHFTPAENGRFFLNISSQQCKNSEGVQVVVIEGNPCQISTYRILTCIPKISQEDIFLELDSLKANTQYLVNVDGFLGDFCEFDIAFSSRPNGFPLSPQLFDTLVDSQWNGNVIQLRWRVTQTTAQDLQHFEIFVKRQSEIKSRLITRVQIQSNARGRHLEEYSVTDSIQDEGEYHYQIVGVSKQGMRSVLNRKKVTFMPDVNAVEINATIPLSFAYPGRVEVLIQNPLDGEMISYSVHEYKSPEIFIVNLAKFINAGIHRFQIKIRHNKTNDTRVFDFQMSESGGVEQIEKKKPTLKN